MNRSQNEEISVSQLQVRILVVIAAGPAHAYLIARRCEVDMDQRQRISNGALYAALKSLVEAHYVDQKGREYAITATGKLVLGWELDRLGLLVGIGQQRLKKSDRAQDGK